MSPKFVSHLVSTALVVTMLVLGGLFGYTFLGGDHKAPANATTPDQNTCLICGSGSGGAGNVGRLPAPFPASGEGGVGTTR